MAKHEEENEERLELLAREPQILDALFVSEDEELEEPARQAIQILRKGKLYLQFTVEALDPRRYQASAIKATRRSGQGNLAAALGQSEMNLVERNARLIVEATIPEHRKVVWNPTRANVVHEWEVVLDKRKGLSAGEVAVVVGKIDELCGFRLNEEREAEDLVGNS